MFRRFSRAKYGKERAVDRGRVANAVARSDSLVAMSDQLAAWAQATRHRAFLLRTESMELRFRHHQLVRDTRSGLAAARKAIEHQQQREVALPSAWSSLLFRLPRGLERIIVAVEGEARTAEGVGSAV